MGRLPLVERLRAERQMVTRGMEIVGEVLPCNLADEAADRIEALERALAQAADNLEAGDRLYTCPGLHKAAQLARAALAGKEVG